MNADTAKITDEETDARRRLLLDQVRRLSSEDELDQYLSDIQALIHVPDALIGFVVATGKTLALFLALRARGRVWHHQMKF